MEHKGGPTVVLAKTVKKLEMGARQAKRATPPTSKRNMKDDHVGAFLSRFKLSIPPKSSPAVPCTARTNQAHEIVYLHERRKALGGYLPVRKPAASTTKAPSAELIEEFKAGSRKEPHPSSTMAFVRLLAKLMKTPEFGKKIVPIIPDEARTFGMEAMFRNYGILCSRRTALQAA